MTVTFSSDTVLISGFFFSPLHFSNFAWLLLPFPQLLYTDPQICTQALITGLRYVQSLYLSYLGHGSDNQLGPMMGSKSVQTCWIKSLNRSHMYPHFLPHVWPWRIALAWRGCLYQLKHMQGHIGTVWQHKIFFKLQLQMLCTNRTKWTQPLCLHCQCLWD